MKKYIIFRLEYIRVAENIESNNRNLIFDSHYEHKQDAIRCAELLEIQGCTAIVITNEYLTE